MVTSPSSPLSTTTTTSAVTNTSTANLYSAFPTPTSDLSLTPSDLQLVAMATMGHPSSTTDTTVTTSTSNAMQFPSLTHDLLADYPIHPAPLSLLPTPHPDKYDSQFCNLHLLSICTYFSLSLSLSLSLTHCSQLCINGHVEHSQQGIDALPDMLCGHLSLDPAIIADVSTVCMCTSCRA